MDVVRIQVPGVGGATAEEMLGEDPRQVGGDEHAGFYVASGGDGKIEVYEWGRLTSGPTTSAGWWILLPFSLLNVAGWMFPAGPVAETGHGDAWEPGSDEERPLLSGLWWARLLVVLGGGLLTALYLVWLSATFVGLVALGCGEDPACADRGPLQLLLRLDGDPVWRLALGITVTLLVWLGLLWYVQRSHTLEWFERPERRALSFVKKGRGYQSRLSRNTGLDDSRFWYRWGEYRRLWRWHLFTSASTIGAVAGASYAVLRANGRLDGSHPWGWALGVPLTVLVIGFALVSDSERSPDSGEQRPARPFAWTLLWGVLYALVALGAAFGIARWTPGPVEEAASGAAMLVLVVRVLSATLFGLAYVLLLLQLGRWAAGQRGLDRMLMPLFAAAFAVMVAGGGLGSVYVLTGRFLLGVEGFGLMGVDTVFPDILLLSAIVALVVLYIRHLSRRMPYGPIIRQYFRDQPVVDDRMEPIWPEKIAPTLDRRQWRWVKRIRSKRGLSEFGRSAPWVLTLVTVLAFAVQVFEFFRVGSDWTDPASVPLFGMKTLAALHPWSAAVIVFYIFPGISIVRLALRNRKDRRGVAKVWDVISFWPRRFHPFGAPSYAERAVPEVRERVKRHLGEGRGVVLASHSQGTVVAYAALQSLAGETQPIEEAEDVTLAQLRRVVPEQAPEPVQYQKFVDVLQSEAETAKARRRRTPKDVDLGRVALVTYGSPLSQLYGPNFPAFFGVDGSFQELRDRLARIAGAPAWRNFYRPTDYIGKRVFVAPGGLLRDEAGNVIPPAEPADACPVAPKPGKEPDVYVCEADWALFPAKSHSGYEKEPQVAEWVRYLEASFKRRRK